jgi:hypothetical protein
MVDNLLFQDLRLIVLLWLGIILYEGWARSRSAACPTTCTPATPLQKRSRDPKLFAGLTHKPYCAACEQPQNLTLQPRLLRPRGFPPLRAGRARWTPLSSSVPRRAVPIMAGWGWAIFGPMAIPAVGAGASSSVSAASSTFWRPRVRFCMASGSRPRRWCGQ